MPAGEAAGGEPVRFARTEVRVRLVAAAKVATTEPEDDGEVPSEDTTGRRVRPHARGHVTIGREPAGAAAESGQFSSAASWRRTAGRGGPKS